MIELFARYIIPAAYDVLPPIMNSQAATGFLLAVGLQESQFRERRQLGGGPGRGMFQFERGGGVKGVVTHPDTRDALRAALVTLRYEKLIGQTVLIYQAIEHNDILATVLARLLLWTVPARLPKRGEYDASWAQYMAAWRAGKPHRDLWNQHYDLGWSIVDPPSVMTPEPRGIA